MLRLIVVHPTHSVAIRVVARAVGAKLTSLTKTIAAVIFAAVAADELQIVTISIASWELALCMDRCPTYRVRHDRHHGHEEDRSNGGSDGETHCE